MQVLVSFAGIGLYLGGGAGGRDSTVSRTMVAFNRYLPVYLPDLVYHVIREVPLLEQGKRNAQLGTGRVELAYCQHRYA